MDLEWARDILKQCQERGAAFHFKQKGGILARELGCKDKEGKDLSEWPADLQVQDFPKVLAV
jgi:protein gp37